MSETCATCEACRAPMLRIAKALQHGFDTPFMCDVGQQIVAAAREIEAALEQPKAREPGWYWVDADDGWEVREFLGYVDGRPIWKATDFEGAIFSDPAVIGPRLNPPA